MRYTKRFLRCTEVLQASNQKFFFLFFFFIQRIFVLVHTYQRNDMMARLELIFKKKMFFFGLFLFLFLFFVFCLFGWFLFVCLVFFFLQKLDFIRFSIFKRSKLCNQKFLYPKSQSGIFYLYNFNDYLTLDQTSYWMKNMHHFLQYKWSETDFCTSHAIFSP